MRAWCLLAIARATEMAAQPRVANFQTAFLGGSRLKPSAR
jgi:hypothetical protein